MLLSNLNLLATVPGGVSRLRELILTLAVQGKLVPQDPNDEPASQLLKKIRAEKDRLIAEGEVKRDKPLAEIPEEEKPVALPQGWEWVRLGNVLDRLSNGYTGDQSKAPSPYPLTRIETISAATINYDRVGYCPNLSEKEIKKYRLAMGDILLSHINSDLHLGKTAIVKDNRLLIHGVNLLLLRPSKFMCAAYINLAITQRRLDGYFLSIAQHAIGQASINQSKLETTRVTLPPAAEQSRIVTRVEELMSLCDALEAKGQLEAKQHAQLVNTLLCMLTESETPRELADNWQRIATHFDLLLDRPEAVDALEQTILQLAVRGLLVPQDPHDEPAGELLKKIRAEKDRLIAEGKIKRDKPLAAIAEEEKPFELPQGWEWVRLPEIYYSISPSGSKLLSSAVEEEGAYPVVDQGQRPIAGYTNDRSLLIEIPGPVIVFGDHTKSIKHIDFNFVAGADGTKILRPVLQDERFFASQLRSFTLEDRGYARHFKVLNSHLFALPPLGEQSRIVARVAQLRQLCVDLRRRLTTARERQSQLAEVLVVPQSTATV